MADIIVNETSAARRTIAIYLVNDAGVGINPSLVSGNVKITKYGGSAANSVNLPTPVATGIAGKHWLTLDATEVDTLGEGWVEVVASGVKSYVDKFSIIPAGDFSSILTRLGTPAGASVSADIASLASILGSTQTTITALHKIGFGRWKIIGTQLVLYDVDNTTPLQTFDLKDEAGNPTNTRIFERFPA